MYIYSNGIQVYKHTHVNIHGWMKIQTLQSNVKCTIKTTGHLKSCSRKLQGVILTNNGSLTPVNVLVLDRLGERR